LDQQCRHRLDESLAAHADIHGERYPRDQRSRNLSAFARGGEADETERLRAHSEFFLGGRAPQAGGRGGLCRLEIRRRRADARLGARVRRVRHYRELRRTGTSGHESDSLGTRSEVHTSELQSPYDLVCRLLLEKKKEKKRRTVVY